MQDKIIKCDINIFIDNILLFNDSAKMVDALKERMNYIDINDMFDYYNQSLYTHYSYIFNIISYVQDLYLIKKSLIDYRDTAEPLWMVIVDKYKKM